LITTALQPSQQPLQQAQSATAQNIIVHQLPAAPPPATQLSVPQQIIITTQQSQPPQPAPQQQQPAQINLQQLQQVRFCYFNPLTPTVAIWVQL